MEELCRQLVGSDLGSEIMVESLLDHVKRMRQGQNFGDGQCKASALNGRYPPSISKFSTLERITFKTLRSSGRYTGTVIYLVTRSVSISDGMTIAVQDSDGIEGLVWSLIEYPWPGGKTSIAEGTILAVKEPYYGVSITGRLSLCVRHPTDLVRLSKFEHIVAQQLQRFAGGDLADFAKAGDIAFLSGKLMEAVDIYSEGITRIRKAIATENVTSEKLLMLLVKRASAYVRLRLHSYAIKDATEVLTVDPAHQAAQRVACAAALEVHEYNAAQGYALALKAQGSNEQANRKLCEKVSVRVQ